MTRPGSKHLLLTGSRSWWYLCIHNINIYHQRCWLLRFAIPERLTHSHWIWPLVKHSAVIPELFWCSWWPLYSQPRSLPPHPHPQYLLIYVSVSESQGMFCSKNYAFSSCLILPTIVDTIHNTAGRDMTSTMPWILNIYTHMFTHQSNLNMNICICMHIHRISTISTTICTL